ncbi:NnrS family protein [Ideonella oryzae]|uniref:NnrS family protein n=1 Tax=Ideonella oryzae TaxID=2937441 RepID=A0ABT1BRD1_9BURK|nr:NnrS family protein [Ideonella oryzae]MCO5978790.1 NnrS family protein [Ideonella oryzae]
MAARRGPWRLRHLLAAPHRLCFAAGALLMTAQAGLWTLALAGGAAAGLPPTPPWLHALAATSGFPLFIAGFGLSAGARWLRQPVPATAPLGPAVAAWCLGWLGLSLAGPGGVGALALGAAVLGGGDLLRRLWRLVRAAEPSLQPPLDAVVRMLALGLLALAVAAAGLGSGQPRWVRMALLGLLWGSLLPAFAAAARRLVPWAAEDGPARWLQGLIAGQAGLLVLAAALPTLPEPLPLMGALTALAWGAWQGTALWRWQRRHGLPNRFVRLLAAAGWAGAAAGAALALAWSCQAAGMAAAARAWQLAATHLLALGYLSGTALAMVSRVSATQSGQAQAVDGPLLALAGLLALTLAARLAVLVVGGPLVPVATLWTLTTAGWSVWLLRWLGRLPAAPAAPSPVRVPPCANP